MSNSVLSVGVQGIQAGFSRAAGAAADIARGGDAMGDLAAPMVDLKTAEIQVKASAAVVRTADDMLGTLINTRA